MFLISFLAFGSLFFWLALIAISILIIALDAHESEGKAFSALVIYAGLVLFANPGAFTAIKANPLLLLFGLLGYLVLGVVTAVIKWYFLLLNVRDAVKEGASPDTVYGRKGKYIAVRGRFIPFPVKVSDFKARIIGWMTLWPWVAVWTLLDDPIRRIFQRIYSSIAGTLQKMADKILGQVASE